jgi:RHS repeat-associated protein
MPGVPAQSDAYWADAAKDAPKSHSGAGVAESGLYTGKTFDADAGTYAFLFRNYDPELSRWTSLDPSGFPDGPNGQFYASVPTCSLDFLGLLDLANAQRKLINGEQVTVTDPVSGVVWDVYEAKTNDGKFTIQLWKYFSGAPAGTDYTSNCFGYAFASGQFWINGQVDEILKGDGYKLINGDDKTGAKFAVWGIAHAAKVDSVNSEGVVTQVTGKNGYMGVRTTTPENQWSGTAQFYE